MKKMSLEGLDGQNLEYAKNFNELVDSVEKAVTPSDVTAIKSQIKALEEKETPDYAPEMKTLKNAALEQGRLITELQKGISNGMPISLEDAIVKEIAKRQPEIMAALKAGSGLIEIDVTKVVDDITTGSGTLPSAAPVIVGTQLAPLGNINLRQINIEQFMTTLATSNGSAYPYTEAVPKDGDYLFVAEGTAKPQIDFEWVTRWASPKKIAAWIKLTEEAVNDVAGLESVARDFLRKKHDLKKAKALLYGTNQGLEPKGATLYGRAFVPGTMTHGVATPNFMDVVNATIVDIATTHNYEDETPYRANTVLVNPIDFFLNVVSAKDALGHPLYPMASITNQVTIGGVTIFPDESVPVGKIFSADLSKYNITNYVPYLVKVGWINDDFIKNQFVILGESRFHQFVKHLDEQAFIYDDIAAIKSAITAPLVVAGETVV
jgi:HK97 family phage major capsid protein